MPVTSEVAFETLYLRLRQEGFRTGVDQHLRMQELLDHVHCDPRDLKTLLCPLFATNPAQQALFYRVFDEVFPILGADAPAPTQSAAAKSLHPAAEIITAAPSRDAAARKIARALWYLVPAVLLAGGVLFWGIHWYYVKKHPKNLPPPPPVAVDGKPIETPAAPQTETVNMTLPDGVPVVHPENERMDVEWTAIAAPLLLFAAFAIFRGFRGKVSKDRREKLGEPHFWPLQLETLGSKVFRNDELGELARRMRQREEAADLILDMPATILSTMRGSGFPSFRYRAVRRPPEYLILIERMSRLDQFAALTSDLVRTLQADGVFVARYYFEGDPRRLFTDAGLQLSLEDLTARSVGARLLLFGSSGCLFHPVTGKLERWVEPTGEHCGFRAALLTDAPRGKRVKWLREAGFAVVPADSTGLRKAIDFFDQGGVKAGKAFPDFHALEQPLTEETMEACSEPGPPELWLAGCAVYPELNWNLTLRLASSVDPGLICEASASRLARMPWLRAGEIPAHWRERLTAQIPVDVRRRIQDDLYALIKTQAVPQDTYAWENWQHTLHALTPPARSWKERARQWFRRPGTLARDAAQDMISLQFLDRHGDSWFSRILSGRLRPLLFDQGYTVLGTRTRVWFLLAVLPAAALALAFRPWQLHHEDYRLVQGTVVDIAGKPYLDAEVSGMPAPQGQFVTLAQGTTLPVTTQSPFRAQKIEMASEDTVRIVVVKEQATAPKPIEKPPAGSCDIAPDQIPRMFDMARQLTNRGRPDMARQVCQRLLACPSARNKAQSTIEAIDKYYFNPTTSPKQPANQVGLTPAQVKQLTQSVQGARPIQPDNGTAQSQPVNGSGPVGAAGAASSQPSKNPNNPDQNGTSAPFGQLFQLGPVGGSGGTQFQHLFPSGINQIRLWLRSDGGWIDCANFSYQPQTRALNPPLVDSFEVGKVVKGDNNARWIAIYLEPGEEITGIGVSSGTLVDAIQLYTDQRTTKWWGGNGGEHQQVLKIPPGGKFAGFVGRSGDSLDAIGLLYTMPSAPAVKGH